MAKKVRSRKKQVEIHDVNILTQSDALLAMRRAVRSSDQKSQYAILATREMWTYDQGWSDSEIAHRQMIEAYKAHFAGMSAISDESKKVLMDIFSQMSIDWENIVTDNTKSQLFMNKRMIEGGGEIIVKSEGGGING